MSEGKKKVDVIRDAPVEERPPGSGVDRTQLRALLALTPAERFRRAVQDAEGLAEFDEAIRRARRK